MHRHEFSCSLACLLKFFPRRFQEWSRVSYKGNSPGVYLFDEIPAGELGFDKFSHSSKIPFIYIFSFIHLFDGVCFQYF